MRTGAEGQMVPPKRKAGLNWFWISIAILSLIVLVCAVLAGVNAAALGWLGISFMTGLAVTAAVAVIGLLAAQRASGPGSAGDRRQSVRGNIYSQAFFDSSEPALITQNGKPIHANQAYFDCLLYTSDAADE